jgi:hypothetical protein
VGVRGFLARLLVVLGAVAFTAGVVVSVGVAGGLITGGALLGVLGLWGVDVREKVGAGPSDEGST